MAGVSINPPEGWREAQGEPTRCQNLTRYCRERHYTS
jgi:hypothetical protein